MAIRAGESERGSETHRQESNLVRLWIITAGGKWQALAEKPMLEKDNQPTFALGVRNSVPVCVAVVLSNVAAFCSSEYKDGGARPLSIVLVCDEQPLVEVANVLRVEVIERLGELSDLVLWPALWCRG